MPTYRSINIALHSQFDVETLPEYFPLPQKNYPDTHRVPKLIDETTSTCSVYIPVLPGSLFWIGYSVSPPVPVGQYFLFKLYINGAHIVSWSTGEEEEWKGKTMFGLYERPEDEDGRQRLEKRALRFTAMKDKKKWDDVEDVFDEKMCLEIRVLRAHGRKRIEREVESYEKTEHAGKGKGIGLINAGRASSEQPKRFYKFALTDPIDQPFATFKYFYRTWEQLHHLGLLAEDALDENDMPIIEPYDADGSQRSLSTARNVSRASTRGDDIFFECGDSAAATEGQAASSVSGPAQCVSGSLEQPRAYIPRGAPSEKASEETLRTGRQSRQRHSGGVGTAPQSYRLSMPPSIKLVPTQQSNKVLPTIPKKDDARSSTAYSPHPAYPVDEWRLRTPSPVKSVREGISTPPMAKSRASSLFSAFTSSWKRRRSPSAGGQAKSNNVGGSRSVSH
ncbi:hypothetical protein HBI56_227900 [Parastagonospora nodorum]|uniref:DUF7918 domain-containing protein n=2 Tax=Phaeosphaeria nodorum (strain SN15 / ATCC MYA-4574 / FGSC 10173) TaxID=321614 RepID=A0A7U2NQ29_PHANO|nr:hypothetical protein SNOG_11689 [Parastagonospora nodorum SN15]KAH3909157.1 hypothetical protein HBH56_160570 [Parastagonospora nodorum]EAT80733.1 hypothetical protein SNOG_11689 [Parastagonospora nodorum SN15]KAH3931767.1 hypothetical protein HBH54_088660 [Parastagonospora nodorum]KAH3996139.1 hypothetical protein HBI10_159140 [Parastagonospora nodorum]KAH4011005.1 hypothetical protein HBI09_228390 [Parastagonospora nodorum]